MRGMMMSRMTRSGKGLLELAPRLRPVGKAAHAVPVAAEGLGHRRAQVLLVVDDGDDRRIGFLHAVKSTTRSGSWKSPRGRNNSATIRRGKETLPQGCGKVPGPESMI